MTRPEKTTIGLEIKTVLSDVVIDLHMSSNTLRSRQARKGIEPDS